MQLASEVPKHGVAISWFYSTQIMHFVGKQKYAIQETAGVDRLKA
jgi:hypothetical protein